MLSRLLFSVMRRTGLYEEVRRAILKETEGEGAAVASRLEEQQRLANKAQERRVRRLEALIEANERQAAALAALDGRLDAERIAAHVRARIAAAPLAAEPMPHIVVEGALPEDFYRLLIEALPPRELFAAEKHRRNFRADMRLLPAYVRRVWGFLDERLSRETITPAVLEKFAPCLERHMSEIFCPDLAAEARALPCIAEDGRVMVTLPGYRLEPHVDPIRVLFTVMLYLPAGPGGEDLGTQLFRVGGDFEVTDAGAFYPERAGLACELVETAPYKANHLLVFLNARAAHGSRIPREGVPDGFERRAYRFYIRPEPERLAALVERLPPEARARWQRPDRAASAVP